MAQIDAPQLDNLKLFLFYQPQAVMDAPQLVQLIGRTPRLKALKELRVIFHRRGIFVSLPWRHRRGVLFAVVHEPPDQLQVLVELCTSSFLRTLIPIVKHLYLIAERFLRIRVIERSQWLELLHPFTAVKDLYLSCEFASHIGPALRRSVGEGMIEVLPSLQDLFLGEIRYIGQPFRKFVAARQLSGHQIAISHWDGERGPWLEYEVGFRVY
jgi:hypothetical protein